MGKFESKKTSRSLMAVATIALLATASCRAGGWVASIVGDVVGSKGDAACDRRYVSDVNEEPSGFCQEVIDTVAVSQIQDDCNDKHHSRAMEGRCPREGIIGGCKLSITNDDGSEVYDWYYDVRDLESSTGATFKSRVATQDDVRAQCADARRYEEGAEFVLP
ncbi:hypothetical protein [Pendulispora albinea]|uniref:Secreted protein n=1 Tax=Pendulispora albinea TaxID=2741071 RepID=A0ABZ2M684_9BACT